MGVSLIGKSVAQAIKKALSGASKTKPQVKRQQPQAQTVTKQPVKTPPPANRAYVENNIKSIAKETAQKLDVKISPEFQEKVLKAYELSKQQHGIISTNELNHTGDADKLLKRFERNLRNELTDNGSQLVTPGTKRSAHFPASGGGAKVLRSETPALPKQKDTSFNPDFKMNNQLINDITDASRLQQFSLRGQGLAKIKQIFTDIPEGKEREYFTKMQEAVPQAGLSPIDERRLKEKIAVLMRDLP